MTNLRPERRPFLLAAAVWVVLAGGTRPAAAQEDPCLTSAELGEAMLSAVREQRFEQTPDYGQNAGGPVRNVPSIDVSVIAFPASCPPAYANVLLSRDLPRGRVAEIEAESLRVVGVRWKRDRRDPDTGESMLWAPGAGWDTQTLEDLVPGLKGTRFVVPYPASTLKLMPAVKILQLIDRGELRLEDEHEHEGKRATIDRWLDQMLTVSSNEATFALTKLLHQRGEIAAELPADQASRPCEERTQRAETRNSVDALFAALGLSTLRFDDTRPCDGSFFNSGGSGVGSHHMTSWDTARLLWLLDPRLPEPSWRVAGRPVDTGFLSDQSKTLLLERYLAQQAYHEVLSTPLTCGIPGRAEGIPADLPDRWYADPAHGDYGVTLDGTRYTADARPCDAAAEVVFAHKTGLTQNYGSAAGIVSPRAGDPGVGRHYVIAFFSNLGSRYAEACETTGLCYTQKIPQMAKRIDEFLADRLER